MLLYNPAAVTITLTHAWAAYAVLPIYVSLDKIDRSLLEAASDLGDSQVEAVPEGDPAALRRPG